MTPRKLLLTIALKLSAVLKFAELYNKVKIGYNYQVGGLLIP